MGKGKKKPTPRQIRKAELAKVRQQTGWQPPGDDSSANVLRAPAEGWTFPGGPDEVRLPSGAEMDRRFDAQRRGGAARKALGREHGEIDPDDCSFEEWLTLGLDVESQFPELAEAVARVRQLHQLLEERGWKWRAEYDITPMFFKDLRRMLFHYDPESEGVEWWYPPTEDPGMFDESRQQETTIKLLFGSWSAGRAPTWLNTEVQLVGWEFEDGEVELQPSDVIAALDLIEGHRSDDGEAAFAKLEQADTRPKRWRQDAPEHEGPSWRQRPYPGA